MNKGRKGFTLVEILIVVAIIAILAGAVLVGLAPTRRAGSDARRLSDLRQIQATLELYFNAQGAYDISGWIDNFGDYGTTAGNIITTLSLDSMPTDPRVGGAMGSEGDYAYVSDGTSYTLIALLDGVLQSGAPASDPSWWTGSPNGAGGPIACGPSGYTGSATLGTRTFDVYCLDF